MNDRKLLCAMVLSNHDVYLKIRNHVSNDVWNKVLHKVFNNVSPLRSELVEKTFAQLEKKYK